MRAVIAMGCLLTTGVGLIMFVSGLDNADKLGSSIGGALSLLGPTFSIVAILQARKEQSETPSKAASDSNSAATSVEAGGASGVTNATGFGATVHRSAVQSGTVGDVAIDQSIIARDNARVYLPSPREDSLPLPPPNVELCLGRDQEVTEIVCAWAAGRAVAAVGGPGMGKSTVLGYALNRDAIKDRYGERRFVVSCDGARSADAVIDKLAQTLGIDSTGVDLRNRVLRFVHEKPCVLVLDNFETVLDNDYSGAVELLRQVRSAPDRVAVGIGYRGSQLPHGIPNIASVVLGRLPDDSAAELFQTTAGKMFEESELTPLLRELDGVPLAIVLLASLAGSEDNLGTLRKAWQAKRTDLLQHGTDRVSSLPVSLELSWDALSTDAQATLSLAAELPDGWPAGDSGAYLPDELTSGVPELSRRALLHLENDRQRCLAPVRQHVRTHHPADGEHLQHLYERVRALSMRAGNVGGSDGAAAVSEVMPEFTNVVEVVRNHLNQDQSFLGVIPSLLEFQRFSSMGDTELAHVALESAAETALKAEITLGLADVYRARSDNQQARELFEQAQPLCQMVGDVLGEAHCLLDLGRISFLESDNQQARELFEQSQRLYQGAGDVLGEAHCLCNLGEIAFRESDHRRARELFEQAQRFYQRVGSVLGEANCLFDLGRVAFRESDHRQARELFQQAQPLYERSGDLHAQAINHAWLALVTTGEERLEHRSRMDELADALGMDGFREHLHDIVDD